MPSTPAASGRRRRKPNHNAAHVPTIATNEITRPTVKCVGPKHEPTRIRYRTGEPTGVAAPVIRTPVGDADTTLVDVARVSDRHVLTSVPEPQDHVAYGSNPTARAAKNVIRPYRSVIPLSTSTSRAHAGHDETATS